MHTKTLQEIYDELKTSEKGLSLAEAKRRLDEYGKNELKVKRKTPWWMHFLKEFTDLMVVILIIAAFIALIAGESREAIVILVIVLINAIIGFVQKFRAEKAIAALKNMIAPNARVVRDGKEQEIDAKLLVPGDIIILEEGDKITADCRLIEVSELQTAEAALTGESNPVHKHAGTTQEDIKMGDDSNLIFMGTNVTHGSGKAIVTSTGMNTKFGHIAHLTTTTSKDKSPLQKELFKIGIFVGKVTLAISAILIFVGIFVQKQEFVDSFLFATSVAVAAVPEGLPATVTIALALGVQRLARKKSIVRQLASVETLGSTSHICTDKTGTLTKNEMTVKELWLNDYTAEVGGAGYKAWGAILLKSKNRQHFKIGDIDSREVHFNKRQEHLEKILQNEKPLYDGLEMMSTISVLCNNAKLEGEVMLGDPTEGSLLTLAKKIGFEFTDFTSQYKKVHEHAFDSLRKRMSVIYKNKEGKNLIFMKGAPDSILEVCDRILVNGRVIQLDSETKANILKQNENMANKALRVMGFAYREVPGDHQHTLEKDEDSMVFVGLAGMIDPPRRDIKQAIAMAHRAGIKVYIVTGDHGLTAQAIAKRIGLIKDGDGHQIVTGKDIAKLKDKELEKLFDNGDKEIIFARTAPEDKLRIVAALKRLGHIVAVTGDGVNDAPALKRADIGIAMGITGTDVSKEASNMVLADDSFGTIINAIREGRTIYQNLKKFVFYIFSCNIGELSAIFTAIILGIPAPLTAILILSVDIGTDVLPALALGVDVSEKGIMSQPPRNPKAKIMDRAFIARFLYVGLFIGAITVGAYFWSLFSQGWQWGQVLDADSVMYIKSSTFAFAILVLIQMVNAYNSRSDRRSVFQVGFFNNLWLLGAIGISLLVVYLLVEVPFFNEWVHTSPLEWYEWFVIIGASFGILLVEEVRKAVVRLRHVSKNKSTT